MTTRSGPLSGRTIAVPETREVELFAGMLEAEGATVFRCPLVAILDAPDAKPIEEWLLKLAAGEFHDVVLLTGEGLRRLKGFAERAGCWDAVHNALAGVRTIIRGPKPAKALREIGLSPSLSAETPTTAGVIATMSKLNLAKCRVGVQLYGRDPNVPLAKFLSDAGAEATFVAPYIYAPKSDADRVLDLIDRLSARALDAIALTSSPQVDRIFHVAKEHGRIDELKSSLRAIVVAAVGPVVGDRLSMEGIVPTIVPERTYFLRPLVNALASRWETTT
jgi:uroporphyrinogen-III synthase